MKKLILFLAVLFAPIAALAQGAGYTNLTGTWLPYGNGSVTASFVNQSGAPQLPLLNGSVFQQNAAGNFDSFGVMSLYLADNNQILPTPSQWRVTACQKGGSQPACCTETITVTGTTQSMTSFLSTCPSASTGGAQLPFPGIVYATSQLGGRLATSQDIVSQLNTTPSTTFVPALLPIATTTTIGGVIVDGTTITIDPTTHKISASGSGCGSGCVQTAPAAGVTQTVVQTPTTNLNVNNFEGALYADQYSTANNGIPNSYAQCLAQNGLGFSGCDIIVSQNYSNADVPAGWQFNSQYYSNPSLHTPSGAQTYDYRNGTLY